MMTIFLKTIMTHLEMTMNNCHVQPCDNKEEPALPDGRGLSVSGQRPENDAVPEYRGRISGQQLEKAEAEAERLGSADRTARDRPLRRHHYLTKCL